MSRDPGSARRDASRYLLLGATAFLLLGGLVMVYSASFGADTVAVGDGAYHLKRQALWAVVGLVALLMMSRFDYRRLDKAVWPVYFIVLAALVGVEIYGVGKWGAVRWIDLGGVSIQPSEYAKLACVLVSGDLLTRHARGLLTEKEMWGRLAFAVGFVVLLVMAQPDMGTTMSIVLAVGLVLLLGGVDLRLLFAMGMTGAGLAAAAIALAQYRAARFVAFLNPWADPQGTGYQSVQALLAFGSGGVDGLGLGMSRQKFFYLPAAHTDFIFAIIGEELGLVGTLAVVLAFGVFAYAGIRIALESRDAFGRLLAGGITAMIVTQAVMNMAAVTGLMPVTGIPMPLVSSGGSSLTFTLLCVGIVVSVSRFGSRGVRGVVREAHGRDAEGASLDKRRGDGRAHLSRAVRGRGVARRRA